jgi:hypothetical protein
MDRPEKVEDLTRTSRRTKYLELRRAAYLEIESVRNLPVGVVFR